MLCRRLGKNSSKWYANQVKYRKVIGEEPGKNLKKWSYSISEVAEMLEISETTVYDLIKREGVKTVTVDYWIRIPKKSFQEWYEKQLKYRTQKDRKKMRNWEVRRLPCRKWQGFWGLQEVRFMGF